MVPELGCVVMWVLLMCRTPLFPSSPARRPCASSRQACIGLGSTALCIMGVPKTWGKLCTGLLLSNYALSVCHTATWHASQQACSYQQSLAFSARSGAYMDKWCWKGVRHSTACHCVTQPGAATAVFHQNCLYFYSRVPRMPPLPLLSCPSWRAMGPLHSTCGLVTATSCWVSGEGK